MYLMNNFFEYSREVESSEKDLNKTQEDLVQIVKKVVRDLRFFINNRNHDLSLKMPEKLSVNIDKFKIEQVITNLLNNAIKYTPPNGSIEVKVEENTTHFIISIKDNGIGVEKEDLKNLFKKYSIISPNHERKDDIFMEGTGLGLYLSKKIVELHEGKIWAESEGLNKGTTFFVKLPTGK
jgi:signal transduction histidine kinase